MTNFSGVGRQGLWSWLTPERAVLVVPVFIGLGLSMALLSVGITPLTLRVREQSTVVEQLQAKADFVPVLRQQLAALMLKQKERDQQLDRLLELLAGTSDLQTFLAELNDMGRSHNVEITTTKPGSVERFKATTTAQATRPAASDDPLLNRGLEKRSAVLTVSGPFEQVLAFLRSLERLEVFVVISEMNLRKQIELMQDGGERLEVVMNLTMSAYGREPESQASSAKSNS